MKKGRGELLFSVTKDDFEIQTFRAGGKGGQNQNKVNSGVRLIHKASGARGEARDQRTYEANRKAAFRRLIETNTFRAWHKIETARRLGYAIDIDTAVKNAMNPANLLIEVKDKKGKWVVIDIAAYPWDD